MKFNSDLPHVQTRNAWLFLFKKSKTPASMRIPGALIRLQINTFLRNIYGNTEWSQFLYSN